MRFQCQPGCTRCCDQQGFVYLADADVPRLAEYLGMTVDEFERKYVYRTKNRARLRTPRDAQCVFLEGRRLQRSCRETDAVPDLPVLAGTGGIGEGVAAERPHGVRGSERASW